MCAAVMMVVPSYTWSLGNTSWPYGFEHACHEYTSESHFASYRHVMVHFCTDNLKIIHNMILVIQYVRTHVDIEFRWCALHTRASYMYNQSVVARPYLWTVPLGMTYTKHTLTES